MISQFTLPTLILFAHVLAGVLLIGSSLFAPVLRFEMRRAQGIAALRSVLLFTRRATEVNPFAALTVLATGLYLGSFGWWHSPWFWVALVLFVGNAVIAVVVPKRFGVRLGRLLEGAPDGVIPAEAERLRWSLAWDLAGNTMLANDVTLLWLMISKPDLAASVAVTVALQVLILTVHRIAFRRAGTVASGHVRS